MSATRNRVISTLERAKAGAGAAGLAAVGLEAFLPVRLLGEAAGVLPAVGAVLAALISAYFANMSEAEEKLELEAGRERTSYESGDPS